MKHDQICTCYNFGLEQNPKITDKSIDHRECATPLSDSFLDQKIQKYFQLLLTHACVGETLSTTIVKCEIKDYVV